jgi:DinB superfamily
MVRTFPQPVVAERYAQALAGADPIESQRKAPKRVRKLIKGLSEKDLARRPAEGKWSIKEVLAHLADGELVMGSRLRYIAAMERPTIVGYDQDAFVANLRYDSLGTEELLAAFAALRAMNVALFDRLPDEAFARVGLHSERGEESLSTMLHSYAGHDRIHEQQIEQIRGLVMRKKGKRESMDAREEPKSKKDKRASRKHGKRKKK